MVPGGGSTNVIVVPFTSEIVIGLPFESADSSQTTSPGFKFAALETTKIVCDVTVEIVAVQLATVAAPDETALLPSDGLKNEQVADVTLRGGRYFKETAVSSRSSIAI